MNNKKINPVRSGVSMKTHTLGGQMKVSNEELLRRLKVYEESDNNEDSEFTVSLIIKHNKSNKQVEMKTNHNQIVYLHGKCTFENFRSIDINTTLSNGIIQLMDLISDWFISRNYN